MYEQLEGLALLASDVVIGLETRKEANTGLSKHNCVGY